MAQEDKIKHHINENTTICHLYVSIYSDKPYAKSLAETILSNFTYTCKI